MVASERRVKEPPAFALPHAFIHRSPEKTGTKPHLGYASTYKWCFISALRQKQTFGLTLGKPAFP